MRVPVDNAGAGVGYRVRPDSCARVAISFVHAGKIRIFDIRTLPEITEQADIIINAVRVLACADGQAENRMVLPVKSTLERARCVAVIAFSDRHPTVPAKVNVRA